VLTNVFVCGPFDKRNYPGGKMTRIKAALSFSNVIAFVALFVALGGSVYAAGKLSGSQIKPNSIPGNRVKAKTLTGKQIKPGSLTGSQIEESTLAGVTASSLAGIQYVSTTVPFGPVAATGTATCPAGTYVIGGGAAVSNQDLSFVNDSGPGATRTSWVAHGFGDPGTSMTVTAICTAAAAVSG
jgi:hypothetical protein